MPREMLFIGLNTIGTSLSMALAETQQETKRIGYDDETAQERQAKKIDAFDQVVSNPRRASEQADLIFLCVREDQVEWYLDYLAPRMKEKAVVFDFSSLKVGPLQKAQDVFPADRYYVGAVPVLNPKTLYLEDAPHLEASADLFENGLLALVLPSNTPEAVVDLAHSLAASLGANPLFIDPGEVDGVHAAIEDLPAALSIALLNVSIHSPGWREIQRMAGRSWIQALLPSTDQPPEQLATLLSLNRDNLVARMEAVIQELMRLRDLIAADERERLSQELQAGQDAYWKFFRARQQADWGREEINRPALPDQGVISRVFGFGGFKRRQSDE